MATSTTTSAITITTTTTYPANSSQSDTSTGKSAMNFEELRNSNWDKIDKYYQKISTDFRNKSQQLTTSIGDADQAQYARYLQPEVNDYQNQIINILQEMMNLLDKNDEIIKEQKNVADKLEKDNDKLIQNIASLKNKKKLEKTESMGHEDNRNLIEDNLITLKKWNLYSKIAIGLFAAIIVLLVVYRIWLESSPSISTITNNRSTLNSLASSQSTNSQIANTSNTIKESDNNSFISKYMGFFKRNINDKSTSNSVSKSNATTRSNV